MRNIIVHAHFYQPPREDPWSGEVLCDPTAAPLHDWNERVASECYIPNASARILDEAGRIAAERNNYANLSFNFGPTLHKWIERHCPELNKTIASCADRAIAQVYNHIIMPLAGERDKVTQVLWGMEDFAYRYGRKPKGMWLAECAVDTKSLEVLAANGIEFTILCPRQCHAVVTAEGTKLTPCGAGLDVTVPYRCLLPSGRTINIIFYSDSIAQGIAFGNMLDNGDRFMEALVNGAPDDENRLILAATDGESYGHHHKFGEMALSRAFARLEKERDVCLPSIEEFLRKNPPTAECIIEENSSWSCAHGIERWRSDCGCCTGGHSGWNQKWRAPLREAFDRLAEPLDELYEETVGHFCDPWQLRNEAIDIYKSGAACTKEERQAVKEKFLNERFGTLPAADAEMICSMIEMQRMRMFMYTSCAWFFDDISGIETRQAMAYAVRAAQIGSKYGKFDFASRLTDDLEDVRGNTRERPTAASVVRQDIFPAMNNDKKNNFGDINKTEVKPVIYGTNLANSIMETLENDPVFRNVAYFSMEIALKPEIPTYSGGLGVLAGDILKSAADLGVPMVGMTLLYKNGYFAQKIDKEGRQQEAPVAWNPADFMEKMPNKVQLHICGRDITIGVWCYTLVGESGHKLPIYFLDTNLPENIQEDRNLTSDLYGGDNKYRLCQELVLGIGGLRVLRDMGYRDISTFHLNEGHAGFLTLELMREQGYFDLDKVRKQVIFTTHTPVAAGHDFFSYDLIAEVSGKKAADNLRSIVGGSGLSMTDLARGTSRYVNGVSYKHALVSREMFNDESVDWITNGVHSTTWTSKSFAALYDKHIPGWRNDPSRFMQALKISDEEIWNAHQASKMKMLAFILEKTGTQLDPDILTIGFARRAAAYKRADLVFSDIERLVKIAQGKVQFVFSGKAHPHDEQGKEIVYRINQISKKLGKVLPVVFIENYNMAKGKLLTSGVDLWLNTPIRPREASGTSGMKCVHNGVMNFSVLDGWWIEGCLEGMTGWAIGPEPTENSLVEYDESKDAEDLYTKLENIIIPTYYENRAKWVEMMKYAIAANASYFNTHRVVREYCEKAYGTVFRGH